MILSPLSFIAFSFLQLDPKILKIGVRRISVVIVSVTAFGAKSTPQKETIVKTNKSIQAKKVVLSRE
ncbi:hypothetical protein D8M27_08490 [Corynebacterium pseudodiphtheriticum]|nr:hypothetical protein D8M37_00675 [Corynebacterium pseudodiphtheriticum]RUP93908.1 hypothetical protein D8M27_08490 [Corynebacterium pseudodiphtheriticum]RUQ48810.1 hypothetical protein D8M30_01185 [Corynebacterium pseudodiphtheriticum]